MNQIAPTGIDCALDHHDHDDCVRKALDAADSACGKSGVKLTAMRRRVLEMIWQSSQPVGAYTLLENLRRDGQNAQPPTIYRALDFLIGQGLVHRIESMNAFVGCRHPGTGHDGHFLICRGCGQVVEIEDDAIVQALRSGAENAGFTMLRHSVEIEGLCALCRQTGQP